MGKKLEGNGIFESSRIILPEHKTQILGYYEKLAHRTKPILHEDEMQIITAAIAESFSTGCEITLVLFDKIEDRRITGVITKVDQLRKMVRLDYGYDWDWIRLDDVVGAYVT
jgi:ethanolamine ammonia-lyase large subunit